MKVQNLNPYPVDTENGSLLPGAVGEVETLTEQLTEVKPRGKKLSKNERQEGS